MVEQTIKNIRKRTWAKDWNHKKNERDRNTLTKKQQWFRTMGTLLLCNGRIRFLMSWNEKSFNHEFLHYTKATSNGFRTLCWFALMQSSIVELHFIRRPIISADVSNNSLGVHKQKHNYFFDRRKTPLWNLYFLHRYHEQLGYWMIVYITYIEKPKSPFDQIKL